MESNTQLIANRRRRWPTPGSATKIENIALLLKAAIEAQGRVGLMLNVRRDDLDSILGPAAGAAAADDLVARRRPSGWRSTRSSRSAPCAISSPGSSAGAQGIVEYPLEQDRDVRDRDCRVASWIFDRSCFPWWIISLDRIVASPGAGRRSGRRPRRRRRGHRRRRARAAAIVAPWPLRDGASTLRGDSTARPAPIEIRAPRSRRREGHAPAGRRAARRSSAPPAHIGRVAEAQVPPWRWRWPRGDVEQRVMPLDASAATSPAAAIRCPPRC